jgi:hypothetical protein
VLACADIRAARAAQGYQPSSRKKSYQVFHLAVPLRSNPIFCSAGFVPP